MIWFQDFFILNKKASHSEDENDFKDYLVKYLEGIYPKNMKLLDVNRQGIDLDNYDFSSASAWLVASVNGRYKDEDINNYG